MHAASVSAQGIDERVQAKVEDAMRPLQREADTVAASVVVLEVKAGVVLAMSGLGAAVGDPALVSLEPGSTIKPLAVAVALEAGLDPARRFDTGDGELKVEGHPKESACSLPRPPRPFGGCSRPPSTTGRAGVRGSRGLRLGGKTGTTDVTSPEGEAASACVLRRARPRRRPPLGRTRAGRHPRPQGDWGPGRRAALRPDRPPAVAGVPKRAVRAPGSQPSALSRQPNINAISNLAES